MKLVNISLSKAQFQTATNGSMEVRISEGDELETILFYDNEILSAIIFALQNGWMPDIGIRIINPNQPR